MSAVSTPRQRPAKAARSAYKFLRGAGVPELGGIAVTLSEAVADPSRSAEERANLTAGRAILHALLHHAERHP